MHEVQAGGEAALKPRRAASELLTELKFARSEGEFCVVEEKVKLGKNKKLKRKEI